MITLTELEKEIKETLTDAEVHLSSPDEKHFEAVVISDQFEGKSLVEQHRIVMNPLSDLFQSKLHALKLTTYTPAKWTQLQGEKDTHE